MRRTLILFLLVFATIHLSAQDNTKPAKMGMVSYTFRNSFAVNFEATLDTIRSLGINNIEFSNLFTQAPEHIRATLETRKMFCTSYGVSFDELRNKLMEVGNVAKILGAEYVRLGWVPLNSPLTEEDAEKLALEFNRIGKFLKTEFGLEFVYHNHGYEFQKWKDGTLFDLIVQKTDPAYVNFELDILWAHIADGDPEALLLKYPDRFKLMHVKDLKKGTTHDLTGRTDINNDVTLGTGEINISEVLKAAAKSKIQYYYIEDESTHVMEQVPKSIIYLREKLK